MARKERRISFETAAVLALFLEAPEKPRFGLEVADETGISSGSLYPILIRLERRGILRSGLEPEEVAREASRFGGRRRRYYELTPTGVLDAERSLAEWRRVVAARSARAWVGRGAGAQA